MPNDNAEARVIQDLRACAGARSPGERLPSVRELMARHRASPVTVQRAVATLAAEGVLEPRPGRGTFVAARLQAPAPPDLSWQAVALGAGTVEADALHELLAVPPPGAIPLSSGYLSLDLQPLALVGGALARAARRPGAWERGPVEGREELRAWFAREAGGSLRAHDVVVCSGGQPALATAFRALAAPGDPVLVEAPTYLGAIVAARAAGLRVVPVPSDADGVRPDLLAEAFARTRARLVYCQPLYANPHGSVLAADRRAAVLDAVAGAGAFLLEDDWARDLSTEADPPPPLAADDPDGHVVYVRSLTKSAAPGLRVAGIGARGAAGARLRAARIVDDFFVSGPLQEAALEVVSAPGWRRHRRRLRAELRTRRDALAAALGRHLPALAPATLPGGGLHLWVALPEGTDDVALANAAAAEGVVVFPGRPWFPAEAPGPFLRLTFAAAPADALDEGVRRLARALRSERDVRNRQDRPSRAWWHVVMSSDNATAARSDLLELANVGPAVARYLEAVGITETRQLAGRDAIEIYEEMCARSGRRLDPCLLDTVMSAVEQADGGPARPWWDYTAERKRTLSRQSRRLRR